MTARALRRFPLLARLEIAAGSLAIWSVLALLGATVRWTRHGSERLERCWSEGEPVLMAIWHGRAIMLPFAYRGRGACVMNSTHRDGEIVSRVLSRFGIFATRGSSTRAGVAGLLGLVRAHRRGLDLALIPDGPKGPAGVAKGGAAQLALATGAPLFPIAISCSRGWRLPTWDRLMLPVPFARMVLVVGDPLCAQPSKGEARMAERESLRRELELRLKQATLEADRIAGRAVREDT